MDQKLVSEFVPGKMSWATGTRFIQKCKIRSEKIGGSRVDTEPTVWALEAQVWNLLWTREEATTKGMLKKGRIRKCRTTAKDSHRLQF